MALTKEQIDSTLLTIENESKKLGFDPEKNKNKWLNSHKNDLPEGFLPPQGSQTPERREVLANESPLTVGERAQGSFAGDNKKVFADKLASKIEGVQYNPDSDSITINGQEIDPDGFDLTSKEGIEEFAKDVADITGKTLPWIGGVVGGIVGGPYSPLTSAAGAGLGKSVEHAAGVAMGVREDKPLEGELKESGKMALDFLLGDVAFATGVGGINLASKAALGKTLPKVITENGIPSLIATLQGTPYQAAKEFVANPQSFTKNKILSQDQLEELSTKAVESFNAFKKGVVENFGEVKKSIIKKYGKKPIANIVELNADVQNVIVSNKNATRKVPMKFANEVKNIVQKVNRMKTLTIGKADDLIDDIERSITRVGKLPGVTPKDLNIFDMMAGQVRKALYNGVPELKELSMKYKVAQRKIDLGEKVFMGDVQKHTTEFWKQSPAVSSIIEQIDKSMEPELRFLKKFKEHSISEAFSQPIPQKLPFTGLLYGAASAISAAQIDPMMALFMLAMSPRATSIAIKSASNKTVQKAASSGIKTGLAGVSHLIRQHMEERANESGTNR